MKTRHRPARAAAVCLTVLLVFAGGGFAQVCPEYVTTLDPGCRASDVALSAELAVVACEQGGFVVVDLSNPSSPVVAAHNLWSCAGTTNVSVFDDFAYVNFFAGKSQVSGLLVFDISQPSSPVYLGGVDWDVGSSGKLPPAGPHVATENAVMLVRGDETLVVDIRVPTQPEIVASLRVGGHGDVVDLDVVGAYAYVLYGGGLFIFDVINPSQPILVGQHVHGIFFDHFRRFDVAPTGHVFLNRLQGGRGALPSNACLDILDVTQPSKPAQIGSIMEASDEHTGIAVSGGYAYVTHPWSAPLQVINVGNPRQPRDVGSGKRSVSTEEFAAIRGYIFVADGDAGLSIHRECGPFYDAFESGDTTAWSSAVP